MSGSTPTSAGSAFRHRGLRRQRPVHPASAGSAVTARLNRAFLSVHPRVGGACEDHMEFRTLILAVHPRAGGVCIHPDAIPSHDVGPPPLWRGLSLVAVPTRRDGRSTPASAGLALVGSAVPIKGSVHPRSGGACLDAHWVLRSLKGPPPRWRGLLRRDARALPGGGSTPSSAGPALPVERWAEARKRFTPGSAGTAHHTSAATAAT